MFRLRHFFRWVLVQLICDCISPWKICKFLFTDTQNRRLLVNFDDRIWSVDNHPSRNITAVGTSGTTRNPLLRLSTSENEENVKHSALEQCNLRIFDFEKGIFTKTQ